jgi:hypothetical protein
MFIAEADKKTFVNTCSNALSHEKSDYNQKIFHTAYKVAKGNQSLNDF